MTSVKTQLWRPPGKNCGLCGEASCRDFLAAVAQTDKEYRDCPFFQLNNPNAPVAAVGAETAHYSGKDVLGHPYDFVLKPLPGEVSARKIVLPFRSDLVEKWAVRQGDYVLGRPMGAGCPVPHVLEVITADWKTGLLETWVVGPQKARETEVKDVTAYHMIGFEGLADIIGKEPAFGCRVTFLPGFCMMNLNHTGLVNLLLRQESGLHVRLEDIRILAGKD